MKSSNYSCICFDCGHVNIVDRGSIAACAGCNARIASESDSIRREFARSLALFGVRYRRRYVHDLEERGSLDRRYSMRPPSELFEFVCCAVAAGIIGNASYDATRAIIRRCVERVQEQDDPPAAENGKLLASEHEIDEVFALLSDAGEWDCFVDEIDDYLNGMDRLDPRVRSVVCTKERVMESVALFKSVVDCRDEPGAMLTSEGDEHANQSEA